MADKHGGAPKKREVLVEFSMSPLDKGPSVSRYVASSLDIIDESGLPYRLGPMGTCVEGDIEEVLGIFQRCFQKMSGNCERITATLKMDFRRGREGRLESKIASVESRLGREVKK
jgi:uncharacterized protein (TIGR00106 family)